MKNSINNDTIFELAPSPKGSNNRKVMEARCAFSLSWKSFRSNPLTAMLRSCLSRFSQTKFRSIAAHSYGFSLAEAMVMLVIVSILMAVSAPLITKKANSDARRLVVQGRDASVVTAMGAAQNFGIGTVAPNAKLHVNGQTQLDGDLTIDNNTHNTSIFFNDRRLTTDGNGNLNISVFGNPPNPLPNTAPQDGYLIARISYGNSNTPSVSVNGVNYAPTITASCSGEGCSGVTITISNLPIIVPVRQNEVIACSSDVISCTFVPITMNIPSKDSQTSNDSESSQSGGE